MKRFAITIVLLTITAFAQQGTDKSRARSAADPAFETRYHEYSDALMKRDLAALDKIWAADYVFINPRGEVVTKAQRVANIKSGATELKSVNPEREQLQVHGNVAIDIGDRHRPSPPRGLQVRIAGK